MMAHLKTWDVFICHATADITVVAQPLKARLELRSARVWIDETELKPGDSLTKKIRHGLENSRFGVVIISPAFFSSKWAQRELDSMYALESDGSKVIIPIWHDVSEADVREYSGILADRVAIPTSPGLDVVANEIVHVMDEESTTPTVPLNVNHLRRIMDELFPEENKHTCDEEAYESILTSLKHLGVSDCRLFETLIKSHLDSVLLKDMRSVRAGMKDNQTFGWNPSNRELNVVFYTQGGLMRLILEKHFGNEWNKYSKKYLRQYAEIKGQKIRDTACWPGTARGGFL